MIITDVLKSLSSVDGPSGYEYRAIRLIEDELKKIPNVSFEIDQLGNLIARREGQGKKITLFAHTDEVGFLLTKRETDNYWRFTTIGGIDPKAIISQRIKIYTRDGSIAWGIVGMLEPHLQTEETRRKVPSLDDLFLDIIEGQDKVNVGDIGVFSVEPFSLSERYFTSKALDNRVSCVTLLYTMELLNNFIPKAEPYFVFNIREEDGSPGAKTVAHRLKPDLAIVLDVTHGDVLVPSMPKIELGKGPALGVGPVIDYNYFERLKSLAENISVSYQIEPLGGRSGTDTDLIQITRGGIPTLLVSLPLRYMHTPYEVVNIRDIEETARLLSYFIARGGE